MHGLVLHGLSGGKTAVAVGYEDGLAALIKEGLQLLKDMCGIGQVRGVRVDIFVSRDGERGCQYLVALFAEGLNEGDVVTWTVEAAGNDNDEGLGRRHCEGCVRALLAGHNSPEESIICFMCRSRHDYPSSWATVEVQQNRRFQSKH